EYINQFSSVAMDFANARPELIELMHSQGLKPYQNNASLDFDINDAFETLVIHENASQNISTKPVMLEMSDILTQDTQQLFAGSIDSLAPLDTLESFMRVGEQTEFANIWQNDADQLLVLYDIY